MVATISQAVRRHHTHFNMHWDDLCYCGGVHLLSSLQDSVSRERGRLGNETFPFGLCGLQENDNGYFHLGSHFQGYSYSIRC